MPIPPEHSRRYVYHFTHLDNLEGIIRHGLLCPNQKEAQEIEHHSIANPNIQHRRAEMVVPCGPGGVVHDYVPFYFCPRTSMLLSVVNAKNVDQMYLMYLALPISVLDRPDVVFTNASANTVDPPDFFSDSTHAQDLAWDLIDSRKWGFPEEQKQARQAEVLVHQRVGIADVDHIIVWNKAVKEWVLELFKEEGVTPPAVEFEGHNNKYHYYTPFYKGSKVSIVTGPIVTKIKFEESVKHILDTGQNLGARFTDIADLLNHLRVDLAHLPETAELVGLESDNAVHHEDVGTHTRTVVENLRGSPEFAALSPQNQLLTELAAFLHDIGKGPKSRWADNDGRQKVDPDHPIGSVEMLRRILTEEVRAIDPQSVRVLAKLVCYHDLVGDIVGKDRDPEQLEQIAESVEDLDMLIALGLADMRALNFGGAEEIPALRQRVLDHINSQAADDE
jgi:hypothetical protein